MGGRAPTCESSSRVQLPNFCTVVAACSLGVNSGQNSHRAPSDSSCVLRNDRLLTWPTRTYIIGYGTPCVASRVERWQLVMR